MILVATGSQKFQFDRLLKKVDELIEEGKIKEPVFSQIGASTYTPKHYKYKEFLAPEELQKQIEAASLLITHAGTGMIINALKVGKKVIGIPRLAKYEEHVDDHQVQLIDEFAKAGLIEPCFKIDDLDEALKKVQKKKYQEYIGDNKELLEDITDSIRSQKIKVLNIITSRLAYNGICTSLLNYYCHIDPAKVQLDFLIPNTAPSDLRAKFTEYGNTIIEMDNHGKKLYKSRPFSYYLRLKKMLKQNHYDVVHVHGSSSMMVVHLLAAKHAGVKVRIAHSRNTKSNHPFLHYLCLPFFRHSYNVAFSCGQEAGEWLFGKHANFTIIPNGKDSNLFKFNQKTRDEYRKRYHLENNIVIGHVGNFNYQKNHEFLLNVFHNLSADKRYHLVLVGTGDELLTKTKAQIKEWGIEDRVTFLGRVPVEEVANLLNAFDLMVFPSRFEGFPNVLIEWQMNGLPCIIADTITRDVKITNLVKFLPLSTEPTKWVSSIRKLRLSNRAKYNQEILKQVKHSGYDIQQNGKNLQEIYLELAHV